jgi:hypothetical protein
MLYVTATMIYGYTGPLPSGAICCYSYTAINTFEVVESPTGLTKAVRDAHNTLRDALEEQAKLHVDAVTLDYMRPLSFSHSFVRL